MTKNCIIILVTALVGLNVFRVDAQAPPVFSQFLVNQYQFNPSYVAHNGYAEANMFYRKQWAGFDNAPEALGFNAHTPMGRNVAIGIVAYTNKTVLLNTSSLLATFGYKVRFGNYSHLNFGLSGGIGFTNFNLEAVETSDDPALLNLIPKSNALNGQFGINYSIKNFNIGIALPALFESKTTTESVQDVENRKEFNPFDEKFGSISYTVKIGNVSLLPTVLYRSFDNVQFQWEGMVVANFKNIIWLGTSYRDGYGITGFIGLNVKKILRIGYAYEHPTGPISKAPSGGTHEVYVGARLGKHNRDEVVLAQRLKKDSLSAIQNISSSEPVGIDSTDTKVMRNAETADQIENVENSEPADPTGADNASYTPSVSSVQSGVEVHEPVLKEHYVVLGVYSHQDNAFKQIGHLKSKGFDPHILYVQEKEFFYVYIFHSTSRDEAVREYRRARQSNQFFGAWIFSPE